MPKRTTRRKRKMGGGALLIDFFRRRRALDYFRRSYTKELSLRREQVIRIENAEKQVARKSQAKEAAKLASQKAILQAEISRLRGVIQASEGNLVDTLRLEEPLNPTVFQREQLQKEGELIRQQERLAAEVAAEEALANTAVQEAKADPNAVADPSILGIPVGASADIVKQKMKNLQDAALNQAKSQAANTAASLAQQRAAAQKLAQGRLIQEAIIEKTSFEHQKILAKIDEATTLITKSRIYTRERLGNIITEMGVLKGITETAMKEIAIKEAEINSLLGKLEAEIYTEFGNTDMLNIELDRIRVRNEITMARITALKDQVAKLNEIITGGLREIESLQRRIDIITTRFNDLNTSYNELFTDMENFPRPTALNDIIKQIEIENIILGTIEDRIRILKEHITNHLKIIGENSGYLSGLIDPSATSSVALAITDITLNHLRTSGAEPAPFDTTNLRAAELAAKNASNALRDLLALIEKYTQKQRVTVFEKSAVDEATTLEHIQTLRGFYYVSMREARDARNLLDKNVVEKPSVSKLNELLSLKFSIDGILRGLISQFNAIDLKGMLDDAITSFFLYTQGKDNGARAAALRVEAARKIRDFIRGQLEKERGLESAAEGETFNLDDTLLRLLKQKIIDALTDLDAARNEINRLKNEILGDLRDKIARLDALERFRRMIEQMQGDLNGLQIQADRLIERMRKFRDARGKLGGLDRLLEKRRARENASTIEDLIRRLKDINERIRRGKDKLEETTIDYLEDMLREALRRVREARRRKEELDEALRRGEEVSDELVRKAEEDLRKAERELQEVEDDLSKLRERLKDEINLRKELRELFSQFQLNFTPIPMPVILGGIGLGALPFIIGSWGSGPYLPDPDQSLIGCEDAKSIIADMKSNIVYRGDSAGYNLALDLNPDLSPVGARPYVGMLGDDASEDLSGEYMDLSGEYMDLSGDNMDLSGENMDLSGEYMDLSGNAIQIDEIIDQYGGQDLSEEELSGQDLSGQDLSGQDLSGQDLSGQDLGEEDLGEEDLGEEDLATEDEGINPGYFSNTEQQIIAMPAGSQIPSKTNMNQGKPIIFERSRSYQEGFNRCWELEFTKIWEPAFSNGYNRLKRSTIDASLPSGFGSEDQEITTTMDEFVEPDDVPLDEDGNIIYPDNESVVPDDPDYLQKEEISEEI